MYNLWIRPHPNCRDYIMLYTTLGRRHMGRSGGSGMLNFLQMRTFAGKDSSQSHNELNNFSIPLWHNDSHTMGPCG